MQGKGWTVLRPGEIEEKAPSWRPDDTRRIVEVPLYADLKSSRCHVWRYPPGMQGRLHMHKEQEEVFVCLEGTFTLLLGDEGERVELPPQSVCVLLPLTPIRILNETDADAVFFIYGAPPVQADGVILAD